MNIEFIPYQKDTEYCFQPPKPASSFIPNWFSKMPVYLDGDKKPKLFPNGNFNQTVKACSPFMDSFIIGYTINLAVDLQVTVSNGSHEIVWRTGRPIQAHTAQQITKEQYENKYDPQPFKFMNEWVIKTPKNYSTLFTHPLNRSDLPFHTLSGVVDTDSFNVPINFPFLLDKDFEGIIERGTPIVQLIPIKRESWRSGNRAYSPDYMAKHDIEFYGKIKRAYKSLSWHKKDYK